MQQCTFDVLIQEEEHRFNKLKREGVVPRYKFASLFYYRGGQNNEKFEQKVQNFDFLIHYVVEQKATIQGIKMSRRVELVLVTRQETIVLPRAKPTIVEGGPVAIRMRYNEPRFNEWNGNIIKGVPRDWSKGIHTVNKVLRPNFPRCTYCHKIGHQINECPFIEFNVRQKFVEHFQNLNPEPAKVGNHGHIEPKGLYHEKVIILNRLIE
jgi:hypothetical protein